MSTKRNVRFALLAFLVPAFLTLFCVLEINGAPGLHLTSIQSNGWVRIYGEEETAAVHTLEASSNLVHWKAIAVLHGFSFEFADPVSHHFANRFYRLATSPLTHTNDWKNQIKGPGTSLSGSPDPFFNRKNWIKFAILIDDPTRVYYAHGSNYSFHYDFATRRLAPFTGLEASEFDRLSLYNDGREVMLGAIILPPPLGIPEFAVQFVSHDPLPRELVKDLFELVKSTVIGPSDLRAFYLPTYEQRLAAEKDRPWLESNGVPFPVDRWSMRDECYSLGWAIGTLKFFPATEVDAAYADGRLLPDDILLTDAVPSEMPYLAGIITFSPTTSGSHVAILAQTYGVPFGYLTDPAQRARALELAGQEVAFQCPILFPLASSLDPALKSEILGLKNPPPIHLAPTAHFGGYSAPVDDLTPADIRFFGGKAANYGLLRRTIPSNAPVAIAISFDLWNEFMAQTLPGGMTLRQEISNRLAGLTYPADIPAIKGNLAAIRSLIRSGTQFTTNQEQAVISALGVFDSRRNIRFRSSTNVEDTENFTGAGLYDSYSGCLDDDLDGDAAGPSHCDPTEDDERGVFRAIRRVYASFYNDNAYLERLRRGVDENSVGMALLVHHSTPDIFEMANGVAKVTSSIPNWTTNRISTVRLTTQKGAVSVANPDASSLPEVVAALSDGPTLVSHSTLLPIGAYVLEWPTDYRSFGQLLGSVADAYGRMTAKNSFVLDFEYKKVEPGHLEVKQVRELPPPNTNGLPAQYLIDSPVVLVPHQAVETDVFAAHRLKSRWTVRTRNMRVDSTNLASTFLREVTIEHLNGDRVETLSARVEDLPGFSSSLFVLDGFSYAMNSWRMATADGMATIEMRNMFSGPSQLKAISQPLIGVRSFYLSATYDQPVPPPRRGSTSWRTNEGIWFGTPTDVRHVPNLRRIAHAATFYLNGRTFTISTSSDQGIEGGDNPWLVGNFQTRIDGLTSQPILLTNFFSQTTANFHVSSVHAYIFEPRLEPGMPQSNLEELGVLDIRMFCFHSAGDREPTLEVRGAAGEFRTVPAFGELARLLSVTVTSGTGPYPAGHSYSFLLASGRFYGDRISGPCTWDMDQHSTTLVFGDRQTSVLTFETETTGTIRTTYHYDENATEDGTFQLQGSN